MKSAVIYTSRYGSTARVAEALAATLGADSINLKKSKVELDQYQTIILGSPIFASNLSGEMKKFIEESKAVLLEKNLGLFICCAHEGEDAEKQIAVAYPQELVEHAKARSVLGGAVNLNKHNFLIRTLLKKVGIKESFDRFSQEKVQEFAARVSV